MATVTFSAADDVLYAYLAGEIDHDATSAEWGSWIRRASG